MRGGKAKGVIPGEPELILEYFRLNKDTRVRRMAFRLKSTWLLASITEFFSANSITVILSRKSHLCPTAFIATTLLIQTRQLIAVFAAKFAKACPSL
jgi:hypothetical protein